MSAGLRQGNPDPSARTYSGVTDTEGNIAPPLTD